jgi:3-hydroxyisobutyrate dehydrogenase-like beta-hydroxyacid dehydrogenase
MPAEKIGFIGAGNLGMPMAVKVVEAGFDMTVHDLREEAVAKLVGLGAKRAGSPAELAKACDIIELMVLNAEQVDEVCLSPTGILATARPETIIVIHSTVGPAICKKVAAAGKERGVHAIDAGVSGGPPGAEARTLSLMVGGPAALVDRCRPLFAAYASNVHHIGTEIGSGQVAKALNNQAYYCNLMIVNEILRVAQAAGVSIDAMLDVVNSSSGKSWASEFWRYRQDQKKKYTTGPEGLAKVTAKDLAVSLQIAHAQKVPAPFGALALEYAFEDGPDY